MIEDTNFLNNQGMSFYKKLNKIKEGFIDSDIYARKEVNDSLNDKFFYKNETKYDALNADHTYYKDRYTSKTTDVTDKTKKIINQIDTDKNPYLKKNIKLGSTGTISNVDIKDVTNLGGYVTNRGYFKSYLTNDVKTNTVGKNGCPNDNDETQVNSTVSGDNLNYLKSLKQGTSMVKGQVCGKEGQNIFVSSLNNDPTVTYKGCYYDNDTNAIGSIAAMTPAFETITTHNDCKKYAADNGYKYFAIQDYNNHKKCVVSNNDPITGFGVANESRCKVDDDGKNYGTNDGARKINAIYQIDNVINKTKLGTVAYIDDDAKLREYPDNMLEYSNTYTGYKYSDSPGNDISTNKNTLLECEQTCNANASCAGYIWKLPNTNTNNKQCYLKTKGILASRTPDKNSTMYAKKTVIKTSKVPTCDKTINNIDLKTFNAYVKGSNMSKNVACGITQYLHPELNDYKTIKNKFSKVTLKTIPHAFNMQQIGVDVRDIMKTNSENAEESISLNKNIQSEIDSKIANENYSNMRMQSLKEGLTMNDIDSMLSDTDVIVLKENYNYILWSALAVGLLSLTVTSVR